MLWKLLSFSGVRIRMEPAGDWGEGGLREEQSFGGGFLLGSSEELLPWEILPCKGPLLGHGHGSSCILLCCLMMMMMMKGKEEAAT
jgi:hypothetical protein